MAETAGDQLAAGGKASFIALAGTITFLVGLLLTAVLGPVGLFFLVLGGCVVVASPVIWAFIRWDNRSTE